MTEAVNPETGEIIEADEFETRAADGGQRYPAVNTLTDLVQMLSDGQFNHDCAHTIKEFAETLEEIGCDTGGKVKGKLTLSIDVERTADGIYFFAPDLVAKTPKPKPKRTAGWVTPDNRFTPNAPRQGNLFGTIRDVSGARNVREAS